MEPHITEDKNEVISTSNQQKESLFASVNRVTPLSKTLAAIIFILLPFIGGYIGYTFAPEKVVEVPYMVPVTTTDDATLEMPVDEAEVELVASPESVQPYECTSIENNYPHRCYRYAPSNAAEVVIEDMSSEAKNQGVLSGRSTLNSLTYTSNDESKIYFLAGIPDSGACCGSLISFDTVTLQFDRIESYKGLLHSTRSLDKRYIATVEDDTSIIIFDLETEEVVNQTSIASGTLIGTTCGMFGYEYDIVFNEVKNGFDYGIYAPETDPDNACKQVKLSEGFISIQ